MATTSSNLTAGTAITMRPGDGTGHKGRATGLVAIAALGLSVMVGALGHGRQAVTTHAGAGHAAAPRVAVALGDRDDPRFGSGQPVTFGQHVYVALGDRDDPRFAGPFIARSTIADVSQPGLLEVMPGEPFVADPLTAPGFRESHGIDSGR